MEGIFLSLLLLIISYVDIFKSHWDDFSLLNSDYFWHFILEQMTRRVLILDGITNTISFR